MISHPIQFEYFDKPTITAAGNDNKGSTDKYETYKNKSYIKISTPPLVNTLQNI